MTKKKERESNAETQSTRRGRRRERLNTEDTKVGHRGAEKNEGQSWWRCVAPNFGLMIVLLCDLNPALLPFADQGKRGRLH
jgi:hypothetical protein